MVQMSGVKGGRDGYLNDHNQYVTRLPQVIMTSAHVYAIP